MSNPADNTPNAQKTPQDGAPESQVEALQAELAETKDKYLRALADLDNFRKQTERRTVDRVRHEKKTLLMRVIEVVDDLERALGFQDVADRDSLLGSLKLTYNQLTSLLQREGVTSFTSQGESFNPHVHEAVESVDNSGRPEGQVVQEMQKGYRYGDELLRPARVHVSSGQNGEKK